MCFGDKKAIKKQYRALVYIKETNQPAIISFTEFFNYINFGKFLKGQFALNKANIWEGVVSLTTKAQVSKGGDKFNVYEFKRTENTTENDRKLVLSERDKSFDILVGTSRGVMLKGTETKEEISSFGFQMQNGATCENGEIVSAPQQSQERDYNDGEEVSLDDVFPG